VGSTIAWRRSTWVALSVGLATALGAPTTAIAVADPAPISVTGSGNVEGVQFDLSVTAGPYGQNPSGHLSLGGDFNFDATPTCVNVSGDSEVVGYRIDTGPDAGKGFLSSSGPGPPWLFPVSPPDNGPPPDPSAPNVIYTAPDQSGSVAITYAGVLNSPPRACPSPDSPQPGMVDSIGNGLVTGTLTHSGGPTAALPLQQRQFDTPTPDAGPAALAQSEDGTIWFLEPAANRLGARANDESGRITEYPIPTPAAGLSSIAPDVSGECSNLDCGDAGMWFTESAADQIGHVSSTGAIAEYPIPTPGAKPTSIAADVPHGGAWFTEPAADKIGHIDESGHVTEYPLPTPGADPESISADEGNTGIAGDSAWFTEAAANKVGYIDAAGNVTEYPVPTAGSGPTTIVNAATGTFPSGAWFVESTAGKLGYIAPSGDITEYRVPSGTTVGGMAAGIGPHGYGSGVWFSESEFGRLGFLSDDTGQLSELTLPGVKPGQIAVAAPLGAPSLTGYESSEAVWWSDAGASRVGLARVPVPIGYPLVFAAAPSIPPPISRIVLTIGRRVTVRKSAIVVGVRCVGIGRCRGRVMLSIGRRAIVSAASRVASAPFKLRAGKHKKLRLRLNRVGMRALRAHNRAVGASVIVRATSGLAPRARTVKLRLASSRR
jgi:virginiamycin B lyase